MPEFNITICDFETGGLDYKKNPVTEVGMLNFDARTLAVNWEYQSFVKPYADKVIDPIVYTKTHVRPEDVANGQDFKAVIADMSELFKSARQKGSKGDFGKTIFAGHNFVRFDRPYAEELFACDKKNIYDFVSGEIIDTLPLARMSFIKNLDKFDLSVCCNHIGYELVNAHSAMDDVRANFALLKYLIQNGTGGGVRVGVDNVKQESKFRKYFNF